jgi:type IV pilus assembly protein PilV
MALGRRQRGAGLIEVAIALLLLSIGALGLGKMQLTARRLDFEALQRAEAAALANDLLERLRVNRPAVAAYASTALGGQPPPAPPADCAAGTCNPDQLQAWDLWQWQRALSGATSAGSSGGLVEARACLAVDGKQVTLGIAWRAFGSGAEPALDTDCGSVSMDAGRQWLGMTSWIGEH